MRKNKVAKNVKEFLLDLIFMTVGSVIYAVGLNGFTAPNNIALASTTAANATTSFFTIFSLGLI